MEKDSRLYLDDILESIDKAREYIEDISLEDFLSNTETQDAVIRRLEIIGEATKRVSLELKNQYPDVPWKKVAGIRDVLIHEYSSVSMETIWKTAKNDLPPLKIIVLEIIEKLK